MSKTHQGNSQKTRVAPLLDFQRGLHTSNSHKKNKMGPDEVFVVSQDLFFVRKIAKFQVEIVGAKVTSRIAPDSAFSGGKCLEVSSKHRCCKKKINEESRRSESDFPTRFSLRNSRFSHEITISKLHQRSLLELWLAAIER